MRKTPAQLAHERLMAAIPRERIRTHVRPGERSQAHADYFELSKKERDMMRRSDKWKA
jgi:hypothetical protein